jgi:hypothetical protein
MYYSGLSDYSGKVTPIDGFSLVLVFDDGQTRVLDMRPFLDFGIFRQIKKAEDFNRVHVAFDTTVLLRFAAYSGV